MMLSYLLGFGTAGFVGLVGYGIAYDRGWWTCREPTEPEANTGPLTLPATPAAHSFASSYGADPHPGAMLDVWVALGGHPRAFERMMSEPRRTPADAWSQLLAVVNDRGHTTFEGDTNPPPGPEFAQLVANLAAADRHDGR